jgi:hypothetical protein
MNLVRDHMFVVSLLVWTRLYAQHRGYFHIHILVLIFFFFLLYLPHVALTPCAVVLYHYYYCYYYNYYNYYYIINLSILFCIVKINLHQIPRDVFPFFFFHNHISVVFNPVYRTPSPTAIFYLLKRNLNFLCSDLIWCKTIHVQSPRTCFA